MTFQDGEEVRDVPGPTNISHSHGEVSGHLCCTGISPGRMGQVHPEKLFAPISSQSWHGRVWLRVLVMPRSKWGTKLCKSARRTFTVGDNSRCRQCLRVWPDVEYCICGLRHITSSKINYSHRVLLVVWAQSLRGLELPALTLTPDIPLSPVRNAGCPGWL